MKYVLVHHAHHPEEGVYRLVYAEAVEHVIEQITVDNPDFDPDADPEGGSFDPIMHQPTLTQDVRGDMLLHPRDVVWADDDEQWEGLGPDEIAAAQRRLVKEALDRHVARQEREQAEMAQRRVVDFGGVGTEL